MPTLRQLSDRAELTELVARLGHWLDDKRFDDILSVYTADATAHFPGGVIVHGAKDLATRARARHEAYARVYHQATNVVIDELDEDRARLRATQTATFVRKADATEPTFVAGERYRFHAVRTPEGWRFSEVQVTPAWQTGGWGT
jgi:3-phenylpropionate/cinnamic acid dioxygenase small subunit